VTVMERRQAGNIFVANVSTVLRQMIGIETLP
jgi:hypothetical protein